MHVVGTLLSQIKVLSCVIVSFAQFFFYFSSLKIPNKYVDSIHMGEITVVLKTGPDRPIRPVQPGTGL